MGENHQRGSGELIGSKIAAAGDHSRVFTDPPALPEHAGRGVDDQQLVAVEEAHQPFDAPGEDGRQPAIRSGRDMDLGPRPKRAVGMSSEAGHDSLPVRRVDSDNGRAFGVESQCRSPDQDRRPP